MSQYLDHPPESDSKAEENKIVSHNYLYFGQLFQFILQNLCIFSQSIYA